MGGRTDVADAPERVPVNDNEYLNESAFEIVLRTLKRATEQGSVSPFLSAHEITWALIRAGHLPAPPYGAV